MSEQGAHTMVAKKGKKKRVGGVYIKTYKALVDIEHISKIQKRQDLVLLRGKDRLLEQTHKTEHKPLEDEVEF